jgi:hypothetical protein
MELMAAGGLGVLLSETFDKHRSALEDSAAERIESAMAAYRAAIDEVERARRTRSRSECCETGVKAHLSRARARRQAVGRTLVAPAGLTSIGDTRRLRGEGPLVGQRARMLLDRTHA